MTYFITPLAYFLKILACILLPISLFAQTTKHIATSPQSPIRINSEDYSKSKQTFRNAPSNPRDILIRDPHNLQGIHTKVNDNGQVINTTVHSCPKLMVDVNIPFVQSCVSSNAVITYCNHGGATAYNAYLEIKLDTNLQLDSASIAYVSLAPQHYRFDVGTIPTGLCRNINLHLTTTCDSSLLGKTHCIDAHIFPDTLCNAIQDKALLEVDAKCLGNALKFRVANHGAPLSTSHQVRYIIIDDHLIANGQRLVLQQGTLEIGRHEEFHTTVPVTQPTHMDYKMEIRDAQNTIIAICFIELCSYTTQSSAVVSDFYASKFWNGSHLPFIDRGCVVNGKTVINANIGSPSAGTIDPIKHNNIHKPVVFDDLHLSKPLKVQIGPNPMMDYTTISLKGAESTIYQFELYSITGKIVRTLAITGNNKKNLEREGLPAGFYVYRVLAKGVPIQEGKILMR